MSLPLKRFTGLIASRITGLKPRCEWEVATLFRTDSIGMLFSRWNHNTILSAKLVCVRRPL